MSRVCTPSQKTLFLREKIEELAILSHQVASKSTLAEKESVLDESFAEFFHNHFGLAFMINHLPQTPRYLIKALIAAGQEAILTREEGDACQEKDLILLGRSLESCEKFYADIGGVIGYQWLTLKILSEGRDSEESVSYFPPQGYDISEGCEFVDESIASGIEHMPYLAEMYPVGGAADRLQLKEEKTGKGLPAARLQFLQTNLLERLVRDLEAREYLYYKLFGRQLTTPIVLMTSQEKECDQHIRRICESHHWFGRPKESFRFICQPLVPTFDERGIWCLEGPTRLKLKPGGHGVIWTLARQEGVFDWLKKLGRRKLLVRQINNPVAGMDYGLLAFIGIGFKENRVFGFASCPRLVRSNEGMNVIRQIKRGKGYEISLTNIEYCDFAHHGIEDIPMQEGGSFSRFPSNTNILFSDIQAVAGASSECPYPGLIANFKRDEAWIEGQRESVTLARLETTMQNIADAFVSSSKKPFTRELSPPLPVFMTYNQRRKTISATKREYVKGGSLLETPLGCLYDFTLNMGALLREYCSVTVPADQSEREFLEGGPAFLFNYHPALGPLWSIIGQKIQKGHIHSGSELQLEIADLILSDFEIKGSLHIQTANVMGHFDEIDRLQFSPLAARCVLRDVKIINKGTDLSQKEKLIDKGMTADEALSIYLGENSSFIAEGVTFNAPLTIDVPPHMTIRAIQSGEQIRLIEEPAPDSVLYTYQMIEKKKIQLYH